MLRSLALAVGAFLVLGLPLASASLLSAVTSDTNLAELQNEIARAIMARDVAALERFYAPEFTFITGAGEVKMRDQVLDEARTGDPAFSKLEYYDLTVRRYGEAAVVTGAARGIYTAGGKRFDTTVRFTRVHVLRDDAWQVVLYQVTRLPAPPPA